MVKLLITWHAAVVANNQVYIEELSRYKDLEVTLLIPHTWDESTTQVDAEKTFDPHYRILVDEVRSQNKGLKFTYKNVSLYLKEINPHVILIYEEPYAYVTYQILKLKKRLSPYAKTVFYTFQNIYQRYPLIHRFIENYVFKHIDAAIAGTEEIAEVLRRKGFTKRISVIPLAVNERCFRKWDSKLLRKQLNLNHFTIGYIGRMIREKGLDYLFRALAGIEMEYQLLLIGNGKDKDYFKRLAWKLNLHNRIIWLDSVENSKLYQYYNCFDLFVLPSITTKAGKEQFGRTLVEAMLCQVPVVGSSSGGIPEVIGDAGIVFPEKDTDSLREKLVLLMNNSKLRKELAQKGYQRAITSYTWKKVAEETHKLLVELCAG